MRLTLRTLLSWKDGMLDPAVAGELAEKVVASAAARGLVERIEGVVANPTLSAIAPDAREFAEAANSTAEYLDNVLAPDRLADFERHCFGSDPLLAETAAVHEILASWSHEQPGEIDAATRRRLLAAVQARSGQATGGAAARRRPRTETVVGVTADAAREATTVTDVLPGESVTLPQAVVTKSRPRPPAQSSAPAWLLVAAAVLLLALLGGVLARMIVRSGAAAADRREAAARAAVPPAGGAGGAPPPAAAPAAPATAEPTPAPQAAAVEQFATPSPPPPDKPASPATEPDQEELPPFGDEPPTEPMNVDGEGREPAAPTAPPAAAAGERAAAEPAAPPAGATTPAAAAGEPRVPQGDALAIAAPAVAVPAAAAADAAAAAGPQQPADRGAAVAGPAVLLYRVPDGGDGWCAAVEGTRLALPVEVVAPPFCRPAVVVDGVRITFEPGTRAGLGRDADGTPRLELAFGAAAVAGRGPLAATVGGISGVFQTSPGAPVGVELSLVRLPGESADATRRIARVIPSTDRVEWRPTPAAGDATAGRGAGPQGIAAGLALAWRSGGSKPAALEPAAPPPAWLAAARADDRVDALAARSLAERLPVGPGAVAALRALAADRRAETRIAAAAALAMLGEFDDTARLLSAAGPDRLAETLWGRLDAAAVQPALARGPRAADALAAAFATQAPPGAADTIVRFARGFSDEQLAAGGAADLVAALESPQLVVRRYAIKNLVEITAAAGVDRLRYRADRPDASLREGAAWWRNQLGQGRVRRSAAGADADR